MEKDITGQTFNHLTALHKLQRSPKGDLRWHFQCSCGKKVSHVKCWITVGLIKSCGHLQDAQYHWVEVNGKTMSCTDFAKSIGIHLSGISQRVKRHGVTHQEAVDFFIRKYGV